MFIIGYLDGGQLATQIAGAIGTVALLVLSYVRHRRHVRDETARPQQHPMSVFTDPFTWAIICCALLCVILPFVSQWSRNANSHERDTVVAHAETYNYTATDIHPNSNKFTADFGDCELPARYWRHDDQVIGTELILPDMQIYGLDTPDRMIFVWPDDVTGYVEVTHFCRLQAAAEDLPSD